MASKPTIQSTLSGSLGWNQACANQFGVARWKRLKKALKAEPLQLGYHPPSHIVSQIVTMHLTPESVTQALYNVGAKESGIPNCFLLPNGVKCDASLPLMYFLDGASCIAAFLLGVSPGEKVLDLCSAPGGKALILSSTLFGSVILKSPTTTQLRTHSLLVCNESSPSRFHRLKKNVSDRVPTDALKHGLVQFTQCSSSQTPLERLGPFDRVLVDAPCSTDRHLLKDVVGLAKWSIKSVKQNSDRQFELLCRGIGLLRDSGHATLIYSTCALSDLENDGVIRRLLSKLGHSIEVVPIEELIKQCQQNIPTLELIEHVVKNDDINNSEQSQVCPNLEPVHSQVCPNLGNPEDACPSLVKLVESGTGADVPELSEGRETDILRIRVERKEFGMIFLPDVSNFGPLYVSGIRRIC